MREGGAFGNGEHGASHAVCGGGYEVRGADVIEIRREARHG
jgi:hypothetical protein